MSGRRLTRPSTGIGSGGFVALGGASPKTKRYVENPRRFLGCELRPDWLTVATENCARAIVHRKARQTDLFSWAQEQTP